MYEMLFKYETDFCIFVIDELFFMFLLILFLSFREFNCILIFFINLFLVNLFLIKFMDFNVFKFNLY